MNSNDLQGLFNAYLQVQPLGESVEQLDELSNRTVSNAVNARIAATSAASDRAYKHRNPEAMRAAETAADKEARIKSAASRRRKRMQEEMGEIGESLNTYEFVLSYLLEEGYASTEQSADKIILNMSESWFGEIIEARRMDKEGVDRGDGKRAERAEKARQSLDAVKKGEERKIKVSKKYGIEPSKGDTVEKRAHKRDFPGSRQAPKEKGKKETPQETQDRRINAGNKRRMTHGWTSKEKAASRGMENAGSRFD